MYDVIIIGAGCAGISAAIYAKRSNLNVMIIEKETPGGQINKTATIENYPGFTKIEGPELAFKLFEQLQQLKVDYKALEVKEIIDNGDYKTIITNKDSYQTKTVIIATGRVPRKLGVENEDKLYGKGISFCSICDGNLYKDKPIAVIGGGNSAIEESLYLSSIASKLTLIHRNEILRADESLIYELKKKDNVEILYNTEVERFNENNNVLDSIEIKNTQDRTNNILKVDGVFVFVGYEPASDFIKNLDILDENGYVLVNNKMETKIPGIYACGDIIKKDVYQIVTAESEGAVAATFTKKYVDNI